MTACAETTTANLPPLPPQIETVAVYRELPDSLLRPCEEPAWSPSEIRTDVDLMGLLSRYRLADICNSAKLKAIERIYRAKDEPPLG